MKVLVIGGSRFSGKEVVKLLAKKDYDVTVLNRGKSEQVATPFYKPIKHEYPKDVKVIHADRTNNEEFNKVLEGNNFEAIIDSCAYNEKDIQRVINIASSEIKNYVFISTASVYDEENVVYLPISEDEQMGSEAEDCPVKYSRDKRRAESLLKKNFEENNFPMTIVRPTYIYGPFNPMYREFYFYDRIMDKKPIYMPGNGEFVTDFVHCKDVAWLCAAPLENKRAIGRIYNATGGVATTLNQYVRILGEIIGNEVKVTHYKPEILKKDNMKPDDWIEMFPFMYDSHLILSKERAVIDLDYKPTPFEEGQKETFNWYKEMKNPEWKGAYEFDAKLAKEIEKE
ncbi:MAG: NAD-dependent epimerase/dehydratase family protein [Candidatus Heimdallarchaeota archaeon]